MEYIGPHNIFRGGELDILVSTRTKCLTDNCTVNTNCSMVLGEEEYAEMHTYI
jgi:hypothetical protein